MADDNGDPWNPQTYAPSDLTQPMDQIPPGTTSQVGLSENDPLRDWSRNLTPDQFKQFQALHAQGDPEGAKQAMIDAGIGPPNGHYTGDGRGGVVPLTRAATEPDVPPQPPGVPPGTAGFGQGAAEAIKRAGKAVGNVFSNPANPSYGKNPMSPQFPQYGTQPPPQPDTEFQNPERGPGGTGPLPGVPTPQQRPPGAPKKQTIETEDGSKITIEHGKGGTAGSDLEGVPRTGQVPIPKPDPRKTQLSTADKLKAESDFAKVFAGIKPPPRPELPKVGTPGVRSPVSVNPAAVNQLLGLVGQQPNPAQARLMQLLGRSV